MDNSHGKAQCVVTTIEALPGCFCPRNQKAICYTEKGQEIAVGPYQQVDRLGYERVEVVEIPGQMAVRGG